MKLPGAEHAVVDVKKLIDYCLNPLHPRGCHKARVFASALQIIRGDSELLKAKLLEAAANSDAIVAESDEYGQRYIVDFECVNCGQRATIRSAWIVLRGEAFPKLTTCFVI